MDSITIDISTQDKPTLHWPHLITQPSVLQYLSRSQKLELLLTSQYTLSKLTPTKLSKLSFYRFNYEEFEYKGLDSNFNNIEISELQRDYIDKLVAKYGSKVNRLNIGKSINYIHVELTVPRFTALTTLDLINIAIPQRNFISILSHLNMLKQLFLSQFVLVLNRGERYTPELINFPINLECLIFYNCKLIELEQIEEVELVNLFKKNNLDNHDNLLIPTHSINNLKSLTCFDYTEDQISTLNNLIKNNLKLSFSLLILNCIDQQTINLISTSSLKSLKICDIMSGFTEKIQDFKQLQSLETIDIEYIGPITYPTITNIILNAPNLTTLKLPWLTEFKDYFNNILSNVKSLKTLKIWNLAGSIFIRDKLPSSDSIEYVSFIGFLEKNFKWEVVSDLTKLKRVRIDCNASESDKELIVMKEGWKMIRYDGSVNLWKL
ncbi:hypothetical protein CONCODRAFT_169847 [Conidiobolus coronatus NRRL 28638]|uniref:RNI-like protein n=1 Tax=Conidiobolus coronatus (strain ATCC 28846 / CBS 209.66 / NRRL 28638) TaxID=796925 RepID=A0A137NQS2_CONC2|nr:hypothetical protein CONCODRAFT_169847 [Conidiobolus coronatus NRRL 28638]|eukprot:KXN65068.1 hypothetical protein CONCODRAFT_169847 [Conidiobolus coronatus NRRL 28638]